MHPGGGEVIAMGKRFFLALLLTVGACQAKKRTMLVVQVDSNMAVPTQLNKVDVAITVNGNTNHWPYSLIKDYKLPLHVGVVEASDGAGDITIVATGFLDPNSTPIVSETAIVRFVEGDSMELKLYLASECITRTCDSDKTCTTGGNCREKVRQPSELTPFVSVASGGSGGSNGIGGNVGTGGNSSTGGESMPGGTSGGGSGSGGLGGGLDAGGVPDAPGDAGVPDVPGDAGAPDAPGPASLTINKVSLIFGTVDVGTTSVTQAVTVTNSWLQPIAIIPTITGSSAFSITDSCTSVPAAGTCDISMVFTPTALGNVSGVLSISGTLAVGLTGTGAPQNSFTVAGVDLGNKVVTNVAVTGSVTVTAAGSITDLSCSLSGADLTADLNNVCPAALAANASCTVGFTFKATTPGAKTDSVVCSATGLTKTAVVTATVLDPAKLVITPDKASFQTQSGTQSAAVTFGVANSGGLPTGQIAATLTGTNADQFAITVPGCLAPLAGASGCSLQVVCNPTSVGTKSANLTIADSSGVAASVAAALTCVSVGPATLTVTGTTNLGSVLIGSTGTAQAFTVKNTGSTASGTLTITVSDPEFVMSADTCTGTSLAAAGTCTVNVALKPAAAGSLGAILNVANAGGTPGSLQLSGIGLTAGALTVAPSSYDFLSIPLNQVSSDVSFTMTNTGGAATGALTVSSPGNGFVVAGNTCSAALAPGKTCVFAVHFAPTVAGNATATVTVGDGTVFSSVTLHGTGVGAPTLTISPWSATFPATAIGQTNGSYPATTPVPSGTTFTVTNLSSSSGDTGALTSTFTGAAAGDFAVASTNCPATLSQGSSCTVVVNFTPTAAGDRAAILQVTSVKGGNATASLDGTGLPSIEMLPCSWADGSIAGGSLNGTCTPLDSTQGTNFGQVPLGALNTSTFSNQEKAYVVRVRGSNAANHINTLSLVLNSSASPADFRIASASTCNGFQADVSLGLAQCVVYVDFYPQSGLGAKTATLTVTGSGGGSASVNLTGTAINPLILSPSPVSFGSVSVGSTSSQQWVAVINYGSVALGPLSFTVTGTNAAEFSEVFDNCSSGTIPGNGTVTCSMAFVMKPTVVGAKTATLTVNGGTFASTVSLLGNGV